MSGICYLRILYQVHVFIALRLKLINIYGVVGGLRKFTTSSEVPPHIGQCVCLIFVFL